ncbi:MAG TPA: hypothetical protein VF103_04125, partial [Polyangiaceae bacterium]
MPCLIGCVALAFPRLALLSVWLFGGDYVSRVYGSFIIPLLGLILLPLTTLTVAFGMNTLGKPDQMEPAGWVLVVLALAADLGILGGSRRMTVEWRVRRNDRETRRVLR